MSGLIGQEYALVSTPGRVDSGPWHPKTEREGFEPSNEVNPRYAISSRAHSTALAPLHGLRCAAAPQGYDTHARDAGRLRRAGLADACEPPTRSGDNCCVSPSPSK